MPIPILSGALVTAALAGLPAVPTPEARDIVRDLPRVRDLRDLPSPEKLLADFRASQIKSLWERLALARRSREKFEKRMDSDHSETTSWLEKHEREYEAELKALGETVTDEEIAKRIRDLPPPGQRVVESPESRVKYWRERLEETQATRVRLEKNQAAWVRLKGQASGNIIKMIALAKKQERYYEDQLKALGVTADDKKK